MQVLETGMYYIYMSINKINYLHYTLVNKMVHISIEIESQVVTQDVKRQPAVVHVVKKTVPQRGEKSTNVAQVLQKKSAAIQKRCHRQPLGGIQSRCMHCPRAADRKTRRQCYKCKDKVCGKHYKIICHNCQP